MKRLRRSVLMLEPGDETAVSWPPPNPESVPDAVLLRSSGAPGQAALDLVDELARWHVDCILDAGLDQLSEWQRSDISSVASRAEEPEQLATLDTRLSELERRAGIESGAVRIEILVTTAACALNLRRIAGASPRVASVMSSPSLLRAALGVEESTDVDALSFPRGDLVLAAAQHGLDAIGCFEPAGHHRIAAKGMKAARFSLSIGLHGGLCATWDEVAHCNRGFAPDEEMVARAHRIIEAMAEAAREGQGAVSLDGRMIDIPFIRLSERILERAELVATRENAVRAMAAGDE